MATNGFVKIATVKASPERNVFCKGNCLYAEYDGEREPLEFESNQAGLRGYADRLRLRSLSVTVRVTPEGRDMGFSGFNLA